jgi:hypothetical protein
MDTGNFRNAFNTAIRDQLMAIERTMNTFNEFFETVDARIRELQENDAELKRLILEQGTEIKALRDRLDGGR